jgi:hypothetical protein
MKVNLDALIPRADFAATGAAESNPNIFNNIGILTLDTGIILPLLRKPDFQRETSEWDKKNIYELLESLFSNDLIPSIILWQSKANLYYVLDGAHRLSALIAWYLDDYGDGAISKKFYNDDISPAQQEIAEKTRAYINKKFGAFATIKASLTATKPNPKHLEIAKKFSIGVPIQWQPGDADKAEKSFFKINKQGAPLNPTERKLLESRRKSNCIAARAIIKRGKGYKYWADFDDDVQSKITKFAEHIHDTLFLPPITESNKGIRSLEQPIAGIISSAQTLPLIYDFITLTNNLDLKILKDDKDGEETISVLQNTRKIAYRINSQNTGSLGLHPVVYFYSSTGRHQPTAVLAVTELLMEFESLNYFRTFISIRGKFEEFIIAYKHYFNQITKKFGSGSKGSKHLRDFLWFVIRLFVDNKNEEQIIKALQTDQIFKFLNPNDTEDEPTQSKKFSKSVSSTAWIKEHLPAKQRCSICNGHYDSRFITQDHETRVREDGLGTLDNLKFAHPYCNSIYKH